MAYYTRVLQPDEQVLIVGRLHWWIYGRGLLPVAIAIGLLAFSFWVVDPDWQRVVRIAAGVIGVFGLLLLLAAWIRRRATEIVVTDRRVIFKRGVVRRHTAEMNISQIETVEVDQGLGGRLWDYGTLLIHGTGSGLEPLAGVGSPIAIRTAIVAR
jgi:membrane protein YdbS with pleckstrin-like domain